MLKPKNNTLSNAFFSGPPCSRARNTDTFQVVVYESQFFSQCVMGRFLFLTHKERGDFVPRVIGTLRSEDGDGRKNVAEKVNSRSFNLHRDYSKSLTLSTVGEPS